MVLLEDFPFVMVTGFIYLRISPSVDILPRLKPRDS